MQFANYAVATSINKKPNNIQVATLLSVIGKECLKIYARLDEESKNQVKELYILQMLAKDVNSVIYVK